MSSMQTNYEAVCNTEDTADHRQVSLGSNKFIQSPK